VLCRRIQNTGQFRRQKRSETKTETKTETKAGLLFRAERSKIADFRAGYANRADFCELLGRNLKPLYLLAFLLTANHKDAERCFSMTAEECLGEQAVFKEWAQSWIKRSLIKNVIGVVSPASSRGCEKRDFWSVEQNEAERNDEINAVTQLPHLERFVFVMSILERYSDWECSVLLGCSTKKVAQSRIKGLCRLPGLLTLFSRLSPEHDVLSGGLR
jgi:DNA-directed RNA polymerase specialized sigma24 family protein